MPTPNATTQPHAAHRRSRADQVAIVAAVVGLLGAGILAWSLRGGGDRPSARAPSPSAAPAPAQAPAPVTAPSPAPVAVTAPEAGTGADTAIDRPPDERVLAQPAPRDVAKAPRPAPAAREAALSPHCTALLQRAAVGERLSAREQQELRTSCR